MTNSEITFDAQKIAAQAADAEAAAATQATANLSDAELSARANELVRQEVITQRLNGDARLWPLWAARQKDYLAYRQRLTLATLKGTGSTSPVDVAQFALAVAAAGAGGSLRRDGTVQGTRYGVQVKAATSQKARWVPYGNTVIDTSTNTVMTKAQAARLGYEAGK